MQNPKILRLSNSLIMPKNKDANNVFPIQRLAKVTITLHNDQRYFGIWVEPKWEATDPPSALALKDKYQNLADFVLGRKRYHYIADGIDGLIDTKASVRLDLLVGCLGYRSTPTNNRRNFTTLLLPMPSALDQRR